MPKSAWNTVFPLEQSATVQTIKMILHQQENNHGRPDTSIYMVIKHYYVVSVPAPESCINTAMEIVANQTV